MSRSIVIRATEAPTVGSGRAFSTGLMALSSARERYYLPFDGVGDYAVGLDAVTGVEGEGVAGEYCFLLKLNSSSYGMAKRAGGLTDTSGPPTNVDFGALAAYIFSSASTLYRHAVQTFSLGAANEGAVAYTYAGIVPAVIAHAYRNGTVASRGIFATAGVVGSASTFSPSTSRTPEHVCVGTTLRSDLSPAVGYAALQWVSCVVLNRWPTDDEVADYSALDCHDALTIWDRADIKGYWVAADASGTEVPPVVGTVPLTLNGGLTSDDLVSL